MDKTRYEPRQAMKLEQDLVALSEAREWEQAQNAIVVAMAEEGIDAGHRCDPRAEFTCWFCLTRLEQYGRFIQKISRDD